MDCLLCFLLLDELMNDDDLCLLAPFVAVNPSGHQLSVVLCCCWRRWQRGSMCSCSWEWWNCEGEEWESDAMYFCVCSCAVVCVRCERSWDGCKGERYFFFICRTDDKRFRFFLPSLLITHLISHLSSLHPYFIARAGYTWLASETKKIIGDTCHRK